MIAHRIINSQIDMQEHPTFTYILRSKHAPNVKYAQEIAKFKAIIFRKKSLLTSSDMKKPKVKVRANCKNIKKQ